MGGARDPDGGYGRDDQPDEVVPDGEDAGYFDDTAAPEEAPLPEVPAAIIRETVVARQEERFGGIKIGAAFFGWLTATAMTVLLAALAMAATRTGLLTAADTAAGYGQAWSWPGGVTGAALLLLIPLLAYFSGGYVAGRMARFNGVGQGLMVWLWAVIVAAAAAVVAMVSGIVGGGQLNVRNTLNELLRLPVNEGPPGTGSIVAAIAVAALALLGSVLGGMVGVHYHRKVDRVGFTPTENYYQP
ncbi:hypothetical protein Arth_0070 [Arthrobacter sp. FB24]|jgi:hypothetical protein|uniref:hypothetical protein n=1 Tax=Arthrobacter sp. (strain FB24) TaxID=290399 RepID=UPI0000527CF0|nr:hypothetical protein [Arthrobacter sp. FB24]ABK01471.1 hypothetical protein Arth_0070 [Arthrobacter sp. FB24]